jgi:hypothetical protein
VYKILAGKHEEKGPLRRSRHRQEYIKNDLKKIREDIHWIHVAQNRVWW